MKTVAEMLAAPREAVDDAPDHRPKSPAYLDALASKDQAMIAWCEMPVAEQVAKAEAKALYARLTREVQARSDRGWTVAQLDAYVARCRQRRAERVRDARVTEDPPCKHWRGRIDPGPIRDSLERTWELSVREWILRDPTLAYLASPSRACECRTCDPAGFKMRKAVRSHVDEFGPLDYPEAG